jgi:acetyltransferase-like isoleucine patch superfamily enzyme
MLDSVKKAAALRLDHFLRYWKGKSMKEQPLIHPTAWILPGARVSTAAAVGRYSYIREGVLLDSGEIGAFCSIGPNVLIGGDGHPLDAVSTHPFWYSADGLTLPGAARESEEPAWTQPKAPPVIGNDVWIGAGAQILRGAVLEDGAVIGAGAIVTGRVPAYGIAVGIPAQVTRHRFDPDTCHRLRETRWWSWDEAVIRERMPAFRHPGLFLEALDGVMPGEEKTEERLFRKKEEAG